MAKKVTVDFERCKGCGVCAAYCPKKILEIDKTKINKAGYNPIHCTKIEECIGCGMCATMCPDSVLVIKEEEK